jgi:cytochrome c oxidase cbb3-type subunit III
MNYINEEEKKVLLDHNYDGIQEFDFALPNWWLATFWGGIIYAVIYIIYYIFLNGPSLKHEYYVDSKKINNVRTTYMKKLKKFNIVKYKSFRNDPNMLLYGQTVYENNCIACHNKNAAGSIGPNLTDKYWINIEDDSKEFFQFIITGNPGGGMPAWGKILQKDDLYAVSAYIKSLKGFKHRDPVAKEPQGDAY